MSGYDTGFDELIRIKTMDKYSTFMAYNTALKMLSEITDYEISQLPEPIKAFFIEELKKQASRYDIQE